PEIVDDVPDVGVGQLALVALHVERRSGAIADNHEDLAVAVAAIPFRVRQVRRMCAFGRHRTVALGICAVAEAAILLERGLPRLDRLRRRGDRIFHLLRVWIAARILRRKSGAGEKRACERKGNATRRQTHALIGSSEVRGFYTAWPPQRLREGGRQRVT